MKAVLVLTASVGILATSWAQTVDIETKPIAKLPDQIEHEDGRFAIYADYENQQAGFLTLFLINATDEPIELPAQDGDVYIKQEAKLGDKWVRSQPHRYSWCGNSYVPLRPIPAGHFLRYPSLFYGWAPPVENPDGEKRMQLPVRYRFYTEKRHEVISNVGEVPVSPALIRIADSDAMAIKFAGVEKLADYASGNRVV